MKSGKRKTACKNQADGRNGDVFFSRQPKKAPVDYSLQELSACSENLKSSFAAAFTPHFCFLATCAS